MRTYMVSPGHAIPADTAWPASVQLPTNDAPTSRGAPMPLRFCPARTSSGRGVASAETKETVMKTLMTVVALAAGMWACAALRAADEKADQKASGGLAALHLTDQQETKIAEIRKEFQPKVQEAAKDLAAVVKEELE